MVSHFRLTTENDALHLHAGGARAVVIALATLAGTAALLLTGCASGLSGDSYKGGAIASASVHVTGNVHGGQNPVSGSTIQLYTVGTSGIASAATPLIGATILSDANGNFSITAQYACTSATQVYLTATGGDPGLGSGTNSTIQMATALGSCTTLQTTAFVQINELTTVAAAYALAPFATDLTHIGSTGSNPTGLVNAFANAQALVNSSTGIAGATSLGAGVTVPASELNTLGDILASCVNSAGTSSGSCTALSNAVGTANTFNAALGIAKNSGATAVTGLFSYAAATGAPFQPSLSAQPKDFSVAITTTGNSTLATPYGIAVDASGNAWVTNETATNLTTLAPTGGLLSNATTLNLNGAQAVAIDRTGNVWVANTAGNTLVKATVNAGAVTGSSSFTVGGLAAPTALAIDSAGNVFAANFNGGSVTGLTNAGAALSGSPFTGSGLIAQPTGIAVDASGNVLVNSGSGSVLKLTNAGAYTATLTDNALQGSVALAIDPTGHVLAPGFTTGASTAGAVSEFASNGTVSAASPVSVGSVTPAGIAADGASLWVTNSTTNGGLVKLTYGSATIGSPATGYGTLNTPQGVAIDASGSIWVANSAANTVQKFIGLAAPVTTPLAANVGP